MNSLLLLCLLTLQTVLVVAKVDSNRVVTRSGALPRVPHFFFDTRGPIPCNRATRQSPAPIPSFTLAQHASLSPNHLGERAVGLCRPRRDYRVRQEGLKSEKLFFFLLSLDHRGLFSPFWVSPLAVCHLLTHCLARLLTNTPSVTHLSMCLALMRYCWALKCA